MNRRGFITGLTGLLCAPALVRASSLDALPRGLRLGGGGYVVLYQDGLPVARYLGDPLQGFFRDDSTRADHLFILSAVDNPVRVIYTDSIARRRFAIR